MMKKKMKKVVCYLMSTVMFFSLFLVTPQEVRAEETQDPTEFSGATLIGNGQWTEPESHKTYNVYYAVPANACVDTTAVEGWSVSGETVTINNLNVNDAVS